MLAIFFIKYKPVKSSLWRYLYCLCCPVYCSVAACAGTIGRYALIHHGCTHVHDIVICPYLFSLSEGTCVVHVVLCEIHWPQMLVPLTDTHGMNVQVWNYAICPRSMHLVYIKTHRPITCPPAMCGSVLVNLRPWPRSGTPGIHEDPQPYHLSPLPSVALFWWTFDLDLDLGHLVYIKTLITCPPAMCGSVLVNLWPWPRSGTPGCGRNFIVTELCTTITMMMSFITVFCIIAGNNVVKQLSGSGWPGWLITVLCVVVMRLQLITSR